MESRQEDGMDVIIVVTVAVGILVAQWAVISLVALGALRKLVLEKLRGMVGPMRRFLSEVGDMLEVARGYGVTAERVREVRGTLEKVGRWMVEIEGLGIERVDVRELEASWRKCLGEYHVLVQEVTSLPVVVDGWLAREREAEVCERRAEEAAWEYNSAAQEYERRRSAGPTVLLAKILGYSALPMWGK